MDSEKAAIISHLLKKKQISQLADAFNLQLRIDPIAKARKAEGPRRVSAEFVVKKVKVAAESKVPRTHAWRMAAIPERERLCSEKCAARTSTRLGKGESASKSKKAAKRGKRRVMITNAGARNQDSSRVTTGAEDREDRELTRKKATLAAAAFEKWVAETAPSKSRKSKEYSPKHTKCREVLQVGLTD